jgi:hypothetical protein
LPCAYIAATGSARSHLPRVACTSFTATVTSTWASTARTMSPPWLTSATSASAWCRRYKATARAAHAEGCNPAALASSST